MTKVRQRLMLVEDDILIAHTEIQILKKYGFDLIHVLSGEEALRALHLYPGIDLILMDIDLGSGMDGIETAKIVARDFGLPVIFLSSHTEPEIIQRTEEISSYGYIVKNSGETVLIASINMAFRLRKSNEQFRLIFENSREAIMLADDQGRFLNINQAAMDLLELRPENYKDFSVGDLKLLGEIDPATRYQNYLEKGQEVGTIEIQTSSGEIRIAEYKAFQIAPNLHQSILRDTTSQTRAKIELEKALEEKTILMNELQHRVRNSFFMISNLITLEKGEKHSNDTNYVLDELQGRIHSLAKLYDILLKSETNTTISLKEFIQNICDSLKKTYIKHSNKFTMKMNLDDCYVSTKDATSWGLITNELITNSLKYAFPNNQSGEIIISLRMDNNFIKLEVSDTGTGLSQEISLDNPKSMGLGLTLVDLLTKQLRGQLNYSKNGLTVFRVTCPV